LHTIRHNVSTALKIYYDYTLSKLNLLYTLLVYFIDYKLTMVSVYNKYMVNVDSV